MSNHDNIPTKIYADEAIRFIADRHHITPQKVVQASIAQHLGQKPHLTDNEVELINGLIATYRNKSKNEQKLNKHQR